MKKIILILMLVTVHTNAQWIGTRSSCNSTCMSEGYNPASGHVIWGDKGTYGAGLTFALEGEIIVGGEASVYTAPAPTINLRNTENITPSYSVCGIVGAQFNPLCLSIRAGLSQYSKVTLHSTGTGPKKLLLGGYVTAMITDRIGLELGGDTFNGSTIGLSYQF